MSAITKTSLLTCRGEILRVLYCAGSPMGVRAISRVASVGVRSAQVALTALVKEQCVVMQSASRYPEYTINRSHDEFPIWRAVFDAIARSLIERRRQALRQIGPRLLPLLEDSRQMIQHAKASHVAS